MSIFRCNSTGGADLCFNGGSCVVSPTGEQACVCPSGFGPDNVTFKMRNCALPNYALLGLFVANAVATVIALAMFQSVRPKAKDRALKILNRASVAIVLFSGEMLALYLENGWYTATSVMVCIVIAAFCWWGMEVGEIMTLPLFAMVPSVQNRVRIFTKRAWIAVFVINTITGLALAVTAQQSNSDAFNVAMYVYGMAQFTTVMLGSLMLIHYGTELRREVQKHGLTQMDDMDQKLKQIINGALSFIFGQLPGILACILMWVLGSAPFNWVIMVLIFFCTPLSLVSMTLAIFKRGQMSSNGADADKNSPFRGSKRMDSPTTAHSSLRSLSPMGVHSNSKVGFPETAVIASNTA